jgi:hypothetical protein
MDRTGDFSMPYSATVRAERFANVTRCRNTLGIFRGGRLALRDGPERERMLSGVAGILTE